MPEYVVRWQMDFEADTPEDAARKALAVHRDPRSIATVFNVDDGSASVEVDLGEESGDVETTITEGKVMCACGSMRFRYEENHGSTRAMSSNDGANGLLFYSDYQTFDGDDDPGVVCDTCCMAVAFDGPVDFV